MIRAWRVERSNPELAERRRNNFVEALHELHARHPEKAYFELPEVMFQASFKESGFDPRTIGERIADLLDMDPAPMSDKQKERRRAYLARGGESRHIAAQAVNAGDAEVAPIAALCLDGAITYGRKPNQDGMLYRLAADAEPVAERIAESAAY